MAESTGISWCDRTWSPWEGCTKVSPGCTNCYAAARNGRFAAGANWGPGAPRRRTSEASWKKVRHWNQLASQRGERFSVFPSLCDPFDNEVPTDWRRDLYSLIESTPNLDWLLLTKRIGNARAMLNAAPLPNVWLGATVVNQEEADRDIPKLLAVPARVRFLSIEPMLGPISLDCWPVYGEDEKPLLHWVICGGESGPKARPLVLGWVKDIVRQFRAAGVAVHVKQIGARPVNREGEPHHITDRAGRDPAEWPEELRVQEFPA